MRYQITSDHITPPFQYRFTAALVIETGNIKVVLIKLIKFYYTDSNQVHQVFIAAWHLTRGHGCC